MIEDIRLSFRGIWSHKMRSFLTMLGIIVGVAAVIAVVSTITGTNQQIKDNLVGDGSNTVTVEMYQDGWPADFSYSQPPDNVYALSDEEIDEIVSLENVVNASAFHKRNYTDSLYYNNVSLDGISVYGIDQNYLSVAGLRVVKGRGFSEKDFRSFGKIALVDKTVIGSVFEGKNPIGKVIDIQAETFTVVGIVEKSAGFEPVIKTVEDYYNFKGSSAGAIYIPDSTWPVAFRYDEPGSVLIKADSVDTMTEVGKKTEEYLNGRYGFGEESNVLYKSTNLADAASQIQQLSSSTNILVIGIASISLLVGGIGVMNIMLVSVTERTNEIGLKKALGAKKRRIRRQFLTEAIMLSGMGGIFGVIAGLILSKIIAVIALIPTAISIPSIIIAVVFSMVIGIVFGMAPSVKASNMNPIEALHFE